MKRILHFTNISIRLKNITEDYAHYMRIHVINEPYLTVCEQGMRFWIIHEWAIKCGKVKCAFRSDLEHVVKGYKTCCVETSKHKIF